MSVVFAGGLATALSLALLAPQVGAILSAHESAPVDHIDLDPLAQRSVVLASDGRPIAALHREQNRKVIPLKDVPEMVVDTILAVEDSDFYSHGGLNVRAATRALFTNVKAGDLRQGGSTITQQLVKNSLVGDDQDLDRKVREAVLSLRLEDQLSKEEILERYLNTVYLGNGAYGLQAASETYFGISPAELDQGQAALLAGLIKNPVGYDPFRYPEEALNRREEVVRRLQRVNMVDTEEAEAILDTPLPTERQTVLPKPNDYFVNEVIRLLLLDKRLGETPTDRYNSLFKGGLTIKTTLDFGAQLTAIGAVRETMPDTDGMFTSALVSVEPSTGAVRALVGGEGFETFKYNIATQGPGRQPGSSFKPFVLAAAIENGISPRSTINSSGPCKVPNPGGTPDPYEVQNFDNARGGTMSLYEATQRSLNCAYIRLGLVTGIDKVIDVASQLGISTELRPVISAPLGTNEVRPLDMAAAYATFANQGVYNPPYFVEEIIDRRGRTIYRHEPEPRQAISADTANLVTDVLRGTITSGTGTRARFPDQRPAAGKTGTTQDYGDAWFVGYTPQLSTAVWMGSPLGNTVKLRNVGGVARVTGGSFPAMIWQAFMGPVLGDKEPLDFAPPPQVDGGTNLRVPGEPEPAPKPRPRPRPRPTAGPAPTTAPAPAPESPSDSGGGGGDSGGGDSPGNGNGNGNGNSGDDD
jgi:penicillin-binding protein 1A